MITRCDGLAFLRAPAAASGADCSRRSTSPHVYTYVCIYTCMYIYIYTYDRYCYYVVDYYCHY